MSKFEQEREARQQLADDDPNAKPDAFAAELRPECAGLLPGPCVLAVPVSVASTAAADEPAANERAAADAAKGASGANGANGATSVPAKLPVGAVP